MNPPVHRRLLYFLALTTWLLAGLPMASARLVPPKERILILVSLDGFRWDYLQKFKAPNLSRLAAEGVQAERLIPQFPSMTFPNHHTIMTGLRPAHHGIIHNNIYDPQLKATFAFNKPEQQGAEWWGGEPVWATAIKQGRRANVLFWPGTGTPMAGLLPTEWKRYDGKPEPAEIVDLGLGWLGQPADQRPSLVTLYFHHTDSVGHKHGPDSPEIAASVAQVDEAIGRLRAGLQRLKLEETVNLIVVSDHGMSGISTQRMVVLADCADLTGVQVDFSGALAGLRPPEGQEEALYQAFKRKENHFHAYRRENTPEEFHFRNNSRIPPVILVAEDGWYLSNRSLQEQSSRSFNKATHGYDPRLDSMGATFIAWGPAFKRQTKLAPVENLHLYNLFCATLGLKPAANDGDDRLVESVLLK